MIRPFRPDQRDGEQPHEDRERQIQEELLVGQVHDDGREREDWPTERSISPQMSSMHRAAAMTT